MFKTKAGLLGTAVGLAALVATGGAACAQDTITIGALTNLEGPFAVPGQDGHRGVDMAVELDNGMAGGKEVKNLEKPSEGTPGKAGAGTRTAGGQDAVGNKNAA